MGLFNTIRRHAAMASGNFTTLFKGVDDLPKLPEAALQLLNELNNPEPDTEKLEAIIGSVPGLVIKILKMVNSPWFGLRNPVLNIGQAVVLLGFVKVKQICLAYTLIDSLPQPKDSIFNYSSLWVDSLLKAMLARELAKKVLPGLEEEAFTAALLADISLPILMTSWHDYYASILEEWQNTKTRLAVIERQNFGWDHSQASAWLLRSWGFSDEIVCYVGAHSLNYEELEELGLASSLALPVATASLLPSVIRSGWEAPGEELANTAKNLHLEVDDLACILVWVEERCSSVIDLFGLPTAGASKMLSNLSANLVTREVTNEG